MAMISVFRPENPADLALAESMLTSNNIPCFVHNRHVSGLFPGIQIESYTDCSIMVPEEAASEAIELLKLMGEATYIDEVIEEGETADGDTAEDAEISTQDAPPHSGFWQKIRAIAGLGVFGIPAATLVIASRRRHAKTHDKS